tara:strand:- start:3943 stop:4497 length:555 start_codon:yes stop_codon:yes gene_type:complete
MERGSVSFNKYGLLPKGDYEYNFKELRKSIFVKGPQNPSISSWDTQWRKHLVNQAEILINQLWDIGITEIWLDGSFAEAKPHPNDIDGYFECDIADIASGYIERELNKRDPHKIWTWDSSARRNYRGYVKKQLPMWHQYRVELYPHYGQNSGITDKHGNEELFPAAFRKDRTNHKEKGIIKLVK